MAGADEEERDCERTRRTRKMRTVFGALLIGAASALDNGLALTPPIGWRSWNCFHGDVDDTKIRTVVDAMATPRAGGERLLSLGYAHVGVDDGWQACGTGRAINGTSGGNGSSTRRTARRW